LLREAIRVVDQVHKYEIQLFLVDLHDVQLNPSLAETLNYLSSTLLPCLIRYAELIKNNVNVTDNTVYLNFELKKLRKVAPFAVNGRSSRYYPPS
jgi:hypothetical protein